MVRVAMVSVLMVTLLAGCGQVILFGHVVGERSAAESKPDTTAAGAATSNASPPAPDAPASTAPVPAEPRVVLVTHAIKAVNLTITAEAAAKVTGDASRFTQEGLLDAIRTELKTRKLLDDQDPRASGTAEIIVDDLATRATTNAVVFGYKMLAGTLEGDIRVTGADGAASTGSRIVAESKLTVAVSGDDKNPLGPLYRRFAVLAADRLAGVASKAQEPTGPPRF